MEIEKELKIAKRKLESGEVVYSIENFEETKEMIQDFVYELVPNKKEILNDNDKTDVKATRTKIRKVMTFIEETRKSLSKTILGEYDKQSKELEKLIKKEDDNLKALLDDYDLKLKPVVVEVEEEQPEPKRFVVAFRSDDLKKIQTLREFAKTIGVEEF